MSKEFKLPYSICSAICSNALNDLCGICAAKGECEDLEVRSDLSIQDMPRFRQRDVEGLKWKARIRITEAYIEKLVDQAQGVIYEPRFIRRPRLHNSASSSIPATQQGEVILFSNPQKDPSSPDRAKLEDQKV